MKNNQLRTTLMFSSFLLVGIIASTVSFSPISAHAVGGISISSSASINLNNLADAQVNAYYTGVSGLSGTSLKTSLNGIIDGQHTYSYSQTPDIMRVTDRDWGLSPETPDTNGYATVNLTAANPYMNLMFGQYNGSASTAYLWSADHSAIWNKEHTWAKSHGNFGETAPAGTDLHHLRASDQANNLGHSNYDYGNVATLTSAIADERGNASGQVGYAVGYTADKVYEPRDEDKGDVARMIFYMATRYINYASTGEPMLRVIEDLSLSNTVTSSSTVYGEMGILSTLLAWNDVDPVSNFEIHRNNLIYNNFQGNRNPYIDHPEWIDMVYDTSYSGSGASIADGSSSVGTGIPPTTATLSSIAVNATGADTSYIVGDTFSTSGLSVTATYSDATAGTVTGYTTSPTSGTILSAVGSQTVTVSYTKNAVTKTATYTINVNEASTGETSIVTLTSSAVTGITTGSYATSAVTFTESISNLSFTYYKMMKRSSTSSDLQCQGGTFYLYNNDVMTDLVSLTLTYSVAPANNFIVKGGNAVNPTSGTVIAPSINGLVYTYNFSVGSFPYFAIAYATNVSYVSSFVFEYGSGSTPPEITLSSIEATPASNKILFAVGDSFTYAGLSVVATYSDASTSVVTAYTVSSPVMTASGIKTVTVTYLTTSDTYSIDVCALTSLSVIPTVTSVIKNSVYSDTGITGTATFSDTATSFGKSLTASDIALSSVDTSTTGSKTVTATYTYNAASVSTTFTVTVTAPVQSAVWGHTFTAISDFTSAATKRPYTSKSLTDSTSVTGSVTWAYTFTKSGSSYFTGYDATKGVQLGSASAPYTSIKLTSGKSFTRVTKIIVETSGAASVVGTLKAYVGSTSYPLGSTYTLTATSALVSFESVSGLSGFPILAWAQTSAKAIYIKSITIYTTTV